MTSEPAAGLAAESGLARTSAPLARNLDTLVAAHDCHRLRRQGVGAWFLVVIALATKQSKEPRRTTSGPHEGLSRGGRRLPKEVVCAGRELDKLAAGGVLRGPGRVRPLSIRFETRCFALRSASSLAPLERADPGRDGAQPRQERREPGQGSSHAQRHGAGLTVHRFRQTRSGRSRVDDER
jgi:hypothetical protein